MSQFFTAEKTFRNQLKPFKKLAPVERRAIERRRENNRRDFQTNLRQRIEAPAYFKIVDSGLMQTNLLQDLTPKEERTTNMGVKSLAERAEIFEGLLQPVAEWRQGLEAELEVDSLEAYCAEENDESLLAMLGEYERASEMLRDALTTEPFDEAMYQSAWEQFSVSEIPLLELRAQEEGADEGV